MGAAAAAVALAVAGCAPSGPAVTTSCVKNGWTGSDHTCSVSIGTITAPYSYGQSDKDLAARIGAAGFPVTADVEVTGGAVVVSWTDPDGEPVSFRAAPGAPGHATGRVRRHAFSNSSSTSIAFWVVFTPVSPVGDATPQPVTGLHLKLTYGL